MEPFGSSLKKQTNKNEKQKKSFSGKQTEIFICENSDKGDLLQAPS